jgi:nucleoid-associated protein
MLKRLIAHQILKQKEKEKGKGSATTVHLRKDVLPARSELAEQLLIHLRNSFQNRSALGGVFEVPEENGAPVPAAQQSAVTDGDGFRFRPALLGYLKLLSDTAFVDLTVRATQTLRNAIAKQPLATGGFVVFVEYSDSDKDYLLTALLNTQARPSFDEDLNLVAANPLDFEHLRHGARIQLNDVEPNTEGVVQFFSQRVEGVSDYFVDFLGCQEMVRPDVQVRRIERVIEEYAKGFGLKKRKEVKERTYGYLKNRVDRKEAVSTRRLARAVAPDDSRRLHQRLRAEKNGIVGRFGTPSETVLKRFVRFMFNEDGLRLEFDIEPWMSRIRVNKAEKTVTIKSAPGGLIAALEKGA